MEKKIFKFVHPSGCTICAYGKTKKEAKKSIKPQIAFYNKELKRNMKYAEFK